MLPKPIARALPLVVLSLFLPEAASAQVFGTFSWQLQPYCNVVTLTLTHGPVGFTLDGTDNLCGAFDKAGAVGVASFNGGGYVTLTFTVVTAPAAAPVHVAAIVRPDTGAGTWTDSAGHTGSFVFGGAAPGLPPRPLALSGLAPSIVTTVEIADGAVGASDIDPTQVQARVTGACGARQAIRGVNADGTVSCEDSDEGGKMFTTSFDSVALPTVVGGTGVLLTNATMNSDKAGRVLVRARGRCTIESSTTSPVAVQVDIVPNPLARFVAVSPDQGIIEVPPEAAAQLHTLGFTAEFVYPFQGGVGGGGGNYVIFDVAARHLTGDATNNTTCSGSVTTVLYR